jgi:serine/threonine protein kinase/Tfp pilus assembly protein PilF
LNSETTRSQAAFPDQERLARILDDYLVAIEQGRSISPEELLAKHPDDAAQLRGYLSGLNLFHAVAVSPAQALGGIAPADIGIPAALQTIGDYRLVREIGRGGMGVVYEAWQVSLRRRVALKVLPFTSAHDAKQIGRFKNEAQAAAQVQHPNIVPVFAIGEENGVHYYVMQLIEGQSLTSLLESLRSGGHAASDVTVRNNALTYNSRRGSGPVTSGSQPVHASDKLLRMRASETLDHIRVVARMGIQAAEALHAAHEYGIVHRDIKPSNLLLDDPGKLWVTDFGLARCRENQGLTQTGDVLGTMRYMSPEQALGRAALVDQRTDIYSLGLTMYELATLNHPADEFGEIQQLFDRNRPAIKPLRHWNRHIPHDFQTIVLKCIAEYPQERYNTAKDLSADLERFMDGRPILASPPSVISRLGKWTKRNRGFVYAAAAVLLVSLVGLGLNSRMLSNERLEAKEHALLQAKDNMRLMSGPLTMFTEDLSDELAGIPGAEGVRQKMLESGVYYLKQLEAKAVDDPAFIADSAIGKSRLAMLYEKLGKRDQALETSGAATSAWQRLVDRNPSNAEFARELARSLNNLALLTASSGRPAEAVAMLQRATEAQKQLAAEDPSSLDILSELATTHSNMGLVLQQMQAKDSAATEFEQAVALQEPRLKSNPDDIATMRGLAASYNNLAAIEQSHDPKAADEHYEKATKLQVQLVRNDPINRNHQADLARTYNNLGFLEASNKNWERAEVWYGDAIQLQERLVKESPFAGTYRRDLAISYNNLGMAQSRATKFAQAEEAFQKAAHAQDILLAAQPSDSQVLSNQGGVWNNLGMLYDRQHRLADAAQAYQQAIHFQCEAMSAGTDKESYRAILSRHYFNYARNLATQSKYDESLGVMVDLRKLWSGNPDHLFAVAKEMAKLDRQMTAKAANETSQAACTQAAVQTLREALNGGLSKDHLKDASLSVLSKSSEFQQLIEDPKIGLSSPEKTQPAKISRVN